MQTNRIYPSKRPIMTPSPSQKPEGGLKTDFKDILSKKLGQPDQLKFSKHALERLHKRGISVTEHDKRAIVEAVTMAESKGAKESLVVYNNNAYVVSVTNRTVITAMDGDSLKHNVFTNIDSAVFWNK